MHVCKERTAGIRKVGFTSQGFKDDKHAACRYGLGTLLHLRTTFQVFAAFHASNSNKTLF